MARNLIRRVIGASNRLFSNAQDTNWSASFDSLIARWQQYEDEMNYIRESKKLPLRWCPPAGKSKLSSVTLAEDSLLKKLSDKCSANEMLANEAHHPVSGEDDSLKNLYDEVFEEAGRRYREKIKTSKKAMKKRLDEEKIPTSSDGPRVQKHSMINPQRLFTPIVKKSCSFTKKKPITYDQKLKKNNSTLSMNQTAVESTSNAVKDTPNKDFDVSDKKSDSNLKSLQSVQSQNESKSNLSVKDTSKKESDVSEKYPDSNIKPLQPVQPQNEPTYPVQCPLVPTHQMTYPLAPPHDMTSSLAPTQHMTSPLVPLHPVTNPSARQTFSQQWNFNRMQRVTANQDEPSSMAYKRIQKPKITFIQPKNSQALYRYTGCNIPVTSITGPISQV